MKAGRELDALVEGRVMGKPGRFVDRIRINGEWRERLTWCESYENPESPMAGSFAGRMPHRYSTDITAAWQVVDRLIGLHFHEVEVRHWIDAFDHVMPVGWMCKVEADGVFIAERADTAPLAICLAALKAVGIEVPA